MVVPVVLMWDIILACWFSPLTYIRRCDYVAGDVHHIKVGSETNIQDNTVVHVAKTNVSGNVEPTVIGNRVTIGKSAFYKCFLCFHVLLYFPLMWCLVCNRSKVGLSLLVCAAIFL